LLSLVKAQSEEDTSVTFILEKTTHPEGTKPSQLADIKEEGAKGEEVEEEEEEDVEEEEGARDEMEVDGEGDEEEEGEFDE